ncbi:MAG: ECF transporter S component, partial [Eggerthellaceae bacterium]|nr:ECF transporter S component [Eggerthellaceae bacterium]
VCTVICALLGNLVITPWYTGMPLQAIIDLILPVLLPFNALKAVLNAIITAVVYKAVSNLIKPVKEQVKGR